jgi:hypothetical protein
MIDETALSSFSLLEDLLPFFSLEKPAVLPFVLFDHRPMRNLGQRLERSSTVLHTKRAIIHLLLTSVVHTVTDNNHYSSTRGVCRSQHMERSSFVPVLYVQSDQETGASPPMAKRPMVCSDSFQRLSDSSVTVAEL